MMRLRGIFALALATVLWGLAPAVAQTGVSDDRVSLPEGPGSLDGIGDDASVNPNMGQMSTSVSIILPPGFEGATPSVSLGYSSGAGNGVAGMGWSFDAPSIERMTLYGVPRYDTDDVFTAGGQLVYVDGSDPREYRSRFEGGFVRYQWHAAGGGANGYWKALFSDGSVGWYGADASGELVDEARVGDQTKGTFRYLLVEQQDVWGHKVVYDYTDQGSTSLVSEIGWVFDGDTPQYRVTFSYADRDDWISDATGGFEEVLDKRMSGVDVFTRGTKVRSYALSYEPLTVSGGFSRLSNVKLFGLLDAEYPVNTSYSYSRALGDLCRSVTCDQPYSRSIGNIGAGLAGGDATLIDMNGDTLADVVDTSLEGAHRFYLNALDEGGMPKLSAAPDSLVGTRSSHRLTNGFVQVLDANSDGFTDMMNSSDGSVLMNEGAGDWAEAKALFGSGSGDLPDAEGALQALRFMDYNGDRKIDLVSSTGTGSSAATIVYENIGTTFVARDATDGIEPIGLPFSNERLELNDINGDGLLDAVRVEPTQILYRLNLGWGDWTEEEDGLWRTAELGELDETLTDDQTKDAELEDMNGDGLADLVLVTSGQVKIWVNENGRSFAAAQVLVDADVDGGIPAKAANTVVLFADMNANGTSDIVWIQADGATEFLELYPVKPNLLAEIDNGQGLVTTVSYATAASHMARDARAGDPWTYRLPFPHLVVDSITTWEQVGDVTETKSFTYHDGYYDGDEKQFRGFEAVEMAFVGDQWQHSGESRMTFDIGDGNPYRAGLLLSRETVDQDTSLQLKTTTYEDCDVDELPQGGTTPAIRYICDKAQETELREGAAEGAWVVLKKERDYDGYGNVIKETDHGVWSVGGSRDCGSCTRADGEYGQACGSGCLGDESVVETAYVAAADNTEGRWMLNLVQRTTSAAEEGGDSFTEQVNYFDGEAFVGLEAGKAAKGFVTRTMARKDRAGDMVPIRRHRADLHGNAVEVRGPLYADTAEGHRTLYTMSDDGLRTEIVEIPLSDEDGPYTLRRSLTYEALFDAPSLAFDWEVVRNSEAVTPTTSHFYTYDAFGRLETQGLPGDQSAEPTTRYSWELGAPTRLITSVRSATTGDADVQSITCLDGRNRTYQSRSRRSATEYSVSGFTRFTSGGSEREVFQPYTSTSADCDAAPPQGTPSVGCRRDLVGRVQEFDVTTEAGLRTGRMLYGPLSVTSFELDDTEPDGPHENTPTVTLTDGLGRVTAVGRLLTEGAEPEWFTMTYSVLGDLARIEDPQGFARVQSFDEMGRVVRVEDADRGTIEMTYDDAGQLIAQVDAGATVIKSYDGAGRLVSEWLDGEQDTTATHYHWDLPGDCPEDVCIATANRRIGVSYATAWGVTGHDWYGINNRGNPVTVARQVGALDLRVTSTFDRAGRPTGITYPGDKTVSLTLDDSARVTAIPGYVTSITNDSRGDVSAITYTNGVTMARTFDAERRLAEVTFTGADQALVAGYSYVRDPAGRITGAVDLTAQAGTPSGSATYDYDAFGRLTNARLDVGGTGEESISYRYDASDNLVERISSLAEASPVHDGVRTLDPLRPHGLQQVQGMDIAYNSTGNVIQRGTQTFDWDGYGRLLAAWEDGDKVSESVYGDGFNRIWSKADDVTTWHLGTDFTIEDGVGSITINIGGEGVARHDYIDTAVLVLSDVAPVVGEDGAVTIAADGAINAADAWVAFAHTIGVLTLDAGESLAPSAVDELLASSAAQGRIDYDEEIRFLHRNHTDTLVAATDSGGKVVERNLRYPFGHERYSSTNAPELYGFTSKRTDPATGWITMGLREYDPLLGRWTAPDTVFEAVDDTQLSKPWEAMGSYSYVLNNPVSGQDETGGEDDDHFRNFENANIAINWFVEQMNTPPNARMDRIDNARGRAAVQRLSAAKGRVPTTGQALQYVFQNAKAIGSSMEKQSALASTTSDSAAFLRQRADFHRALLKYEGGGSSSSRFIPGLQTRRRVAPLSTINEVESIDMSKVESKRATLKAIQDFDDANSVSTTSFSEDKKSMTWKTSKIQNRTFSGDGIMSFGDVSTTITSLPTSRDRSGGLGTRSASRAKIAKGKKRGIFSGLSGLFSKMKRKKK